jgi:NADPH:quinone reductase-like Zn-dependent oxidoreductase
MVEGGHCGVVRSAYVDALGDVSIIRYGELPDPVARAGQVLVRVEAVAVNSVDTYLRSGRWRTKVCFPLVLGRDLVGTVAALGAGVSDAQLGRRVWTNSAGYGGRPGATAEFVVVDQERLYPLPAGADPVEFVAAVHPGATAHGALLGRARLHRGETVAVIGANGAVGCCMVQIAAASGAEVVGVVRDGRAAGRLRAWGADRVVIAESAQALEAAGAAAPNGMDLLVDTTGHVDLGDTPDLLNPRGRVLLIAGQGRLNLDLWRFYTRETQLLGFVMSRMTVTELAAAAEWINDRYAEQPLSAGVATVMNFADTAQAHALLESRQLPRTADGIVGRIVLQP